MSAVQAVEDFIVNSPFLNEGEITNPLRDPFGPAGGDGTISYLIDDDAFDINVNVSNLIPGGVSSGLTQNVQNFATEDTSFAGLAGVGGSSGVGATLDGTSVPGQTTAGSLRTSASTTFEIVQYPQDVTSGPFMMLTFLEKSQSSQLVSQESIASPIDDTLTDLPSSVASQVGQGINDILSSVNDITGGVVGGIGDVLDSIGGVLGNIDPDILRRLGIDGFFDPTAKILDAGRVLREFGSDVTTTTTNIINAVNGRESTFSPVQFTINESIALPLPATHTDTTSGEWSGVNLGFAGEMVGKAMQNMKDGRLGAEASSTLSNAGDLLKESIQGLMERGEFLLGGKVIGEDVFSAATGTLVNPRRARLFQGNQLREWGFDYIFAPSNQQEVNSVKKIIFLLRKNAHAKLSPSGKDFVLEYPTEVQCKFFDSNGQDYQGVDKALPNMKNCFIQNVTVTYSSEGKRWTALKDDPSKLPTHISVKFTLLEVSALKQEDILEGF